MSVVLVIGWRSWYDLFLFLDLQEDRWVLIFGSLICGFDFAISDLLFVGLIFANSELGFEV
ncbi:hypothetical protein HanIR_Chr12g0606221 [Helianthus annuus]|nr:hypothetical protein HanIR_Chr12g0606221 [Helianthus annuus]